MSDDNKEGAGVPVAVVGEGFAIFWAGSGSIAPIVEKHGLKVGSMLYATPRAVMPAAPSDAGWQPLATAPAGERVLLGPRHAPVVGIVRQMPEWADEQDPVAAVIHYNDTTLVAGYHCSEWHPLPAVNATQAEPAAGEQAGAVTRDAAIELVSFYRKAVIEALGGGAEEVATMHAEQRRLVNALAAPGAAIAAREQEGKSAAWDALRRSLVLRHVQVSIGDVIDTMEMLLAKLTSAELASRNEAPAVDVREQEDKS